MKSVQQFGNAYYAFNIKIWFSIASKNWKQTLIAYSIEKLAQNFMLERN